MIVILIAVANKNSIFIPEQRKKQLNNFYKKYASTWYNSSVKNNGLVSKKGICAVIYSTKFELLLIYCFVVLVLFLSSLVSSLVSRAVQASCNLIRFKIKTYAKNCNKAEQKWTLKL